MEDIDIQAFTDRMVTHDVRMKHIEIANQVEHELQNSIALPLVIDVAKKEADEALALLAVVDPSDYKKIIALQGKIYCATMLTNILLAVRRRGLFSAQDMQKEQELGELPDGEEAN